MLVQADNGKARGGSPRWTILFWRGVDASKRRWHEPSARQKGIMPVYRWTGPGRDGLEVAYGKAESRPHVSTVREVWRERHGHRAALEALREARELGYRIGVLQSSAMGFGVYRRLGFERYSTYHIYVGTGQE